MSETEHRIQAELRRVIGPAGYEFATAHQDDGKLLIRIDAGEAVWAMCPEELLQLLQSMPDRAGPLALRQAADQHPHKVTCE